MRPFRQVIRADFERYLLGSPLNARRACSTVLRYPGLQALLVYRFGRILLGCMRRPWWWPLLPLAVFLYLLAVTTVRSCYGIRLFQSAQIGAGCSILHFGGIEIANCRLGENCSVAQGTRIGSRSDGRGPTVGDTVWIGAHTRVLGPVVIGDGATIGPGSRVIKAVPKRALVLGNPARIVFPAFDNSRIQPRG
ncbi:MAG: serine O-acetyltransferase [Steroidobacteraceae bacterium]